MRFLSLLLFLAIAGCSTAGPFVTSISSDGRGGLIIEKSLIELNTFTGTISNQGQETTTVYLYPQVREPETRNPREAAPLPGWQDRQ